MLVNLVNPYMLNWFNNLNRDIYLNNKLELANLCNKDIPNKDNKHSNLNNKLEVNLCNKDIPNKDNKRSNLNNKLEVNICNKDIPNKDNKHSNLICLCLKDIHKDNKDWWICGYADNLSNRINLMVVM